MYDNVLVLILDPKCFLQTCETAKSFIRQIATTSLLSNVILNYQWNREKWRGGAVPQVSMLLH